ncbi:hypothetical protein M0812_11477 [Anaeramoeba flamelloides]|uniref:D-isomer specific 2-hydroxyacid dehydrogenase NAD-binding domain-containing protein n=1 Tax=Anaeramoeba flamelloides TaxID=1746091 RepID=A0AAV7ZZ41_9EUKA|nr:hypothetical protein M0812_11477 [Anaeramoeba flamelloides]
MKKFLNSKINSPTVLTNYNLKKTVLEKLTNCCKLKLFGECNKQDQPKVDFILSGIGSRTLFQEISNDKYPNLKAVFHCGPDLEEEHYNSLLKKNIDIIFSVPKRNRHLPEVSFTLLLTAIRQLFSADKYVRTGLFKDKSPSVFLGETLENKKVAVIGEEKDLQVFKKYSHPFQFQLLTAKVPQLGCDRNGSSTNLKKLFQAQKLKVQQIIRQADYVCVMDETFHKSPTPLVDDQFLFSLKSPNKKLIVTGSRSSVDVNSLLDYLLNGKIKSVAIDTFENPNSSNIKLLSKFPNIILTPKLAYSNHECREEMVNLAIQKLLKYVK